MTEFPCPQCGSSRTHKNGIDKRVGKQKMKCGDCGKNFYKEYSPSPQTRVNTPQAPAHTNGEVKKHRGISEADLRSKYDLSFIVRKKAGEIPRGEFLSEAEFIQSCNIKGMSGYRPVLDHPEFDKYKGKAGGTIYWGHPERIAVLKEDHVLT